MAAKKSNPMVSAERILEFKIPTIAPNTIGTHFIDLAQSVSALNHRFYRQGCMYHVSKIEVIPFLAGAGSADTLTISRAPVTWMTSGGWTKTQAIWQQRQNEAMKETHSTGTARYRDFKVFLNNEHFLLYDGGQDNLLPRDVLGDTPVGAEWDYSTIEIPQQNVGSGNPSQEHLILLGSNIIGAKSCLSGWFESRAQVPTVDPTESNPQSGWYAELENSDQASGFIVEAATDQNDTPPYNPLAAIGCGLGNCDSPWPHARMTLDTVDNGVITVSGGDFPCGLIKLDTYNSSTTSNMDNLLVRVHLKAGNHKGIACTPMGAVN